MGKWMDTQQAIIFGFCPASAVTALGYEREEESYFRLLSVPTLLAAPCRLFLLVMSPAAMTQQLHRVRHFFCAGRPEEDGEVLAMQPSLVLVGAGLGGDAREQQG